MPFAKLGRARLHYEVRGPEDGPPLLLIRGLARSKSYWLEFGERCAEKYRVCFFDNRGVGHSNTPLTGWTTRNMAREALAVMDAAGFESACVLGHSLGGMIAQWVALEAPSRVQALALGSTLPGGFTRSQPPPKDALALLIRCTGKKLERSFEVTAPICLSHESMATRPEIVDQWLALAREEPESRRGVALQAIAGATHNAGRRLHEVRCKSWVFTGDADRLVPARNSYRLASLLPDAELTVFSGVGHDVPTERTSETFAAMDDFFMRATSQTKSRRSSAAKAVPSSARV